MSSQYRVSPKSSEPEGSHTEDKGVHVDRRQFMRYGLTASTAVFAASIGAIGYASVLMPGGGGAAGDLAVKYWVPKGQEDSAWYATSHNQPVKISELADQAATTSAKMAGASGVWNGLPVIITYVPDSSFQGTPAADNKPRLQYIEGVDSSGSVVAHAEDRLTDPAMPHDNIVLIFGRCTHLCCIPGWQLVSNDFTADNWSAGGTDAGGSKLFCICHSSRFDPTVIEVNRNIVGVEYIGIKRTGGPAPTGLPIIPFDVEGDTIIGRADNLEWYTYCE